MQRRGYRVGDLLWVGQGSQRHEESPVFERIQRAPSNLQGKPGLPGPAGARKGHDPGPGQQIGQLGDLLVASYEARELRRQVVRLATQRFDRWELRRKAFDEKLSQPLGPR